MSESGVYSSPTYIGTYLQVISRALVAAEVDPAAVFAAARVEPVRANDPLVRITEPEVNAIFASAVEATGDHCFGLRVAESVMPGMLHALGYALLASDTLAGLCQRLVRYWGLIAQGSDFELLENDGELQLYGSPQNPDLCFETQDAWAAVVLRLMRAVYHEDLVPIGVELIRPQPECGGGPFREFFGCPIEFERERICLHFDLAVAREPLPGAGPELAQYNDQIVLGYLDKLDREDIVNRVRSLIVDGLGAGTFSRTDVAERLHMSASSLQVKLARRKLSFQKILDDTRHDLAMGYINQSYLSVTEIAFMLGFSDLSNFIRAFKRWSGRTPTEYRASKYP